MAALVEWRHSLTVAAFTKLSVNTVPVCSSALCSDSSRSILQSVWEYLNLRQVVFGFFLKSKLIVKIKLGSGFQFLWSDCPCLLLCLPVLFIPPLSLSPSFRAIAASSLVLSRGFSEAILHLYCTRVHLKDFVIPIEVYLCLKAFPLHNACSNVALN